MPFDASAVSHSISPRSGGSCRAERGSQRRRRRAAYSYWSSSRVRDSHANHNARGRGKSSALVRTATKPEEFAFVPDSQHRKGANARRVCMGGGTLPVATLVLP